MYKTTATTKSTLTLLLMVTLAIVLGSGSEASFPEYDNYVHNYVEPSGNWTYMEKPMFPVRFNESQITIGQNWSIVCPLRENHSYHAYCYGDWIDTSSLPKTDYDIYIRNSLGEQEGYYTEAAGLPEHMGNRADEPFFKPKHSGNYTFIINNDARESNGAEEATFMIVENVECNVWHEHYVEGKDDHDMPVFNTSWCYEFATASPYFEVFVDVPDSLDMYETRLYLMSNPQSPNYTLLNNVPLAWEPGLFGEINDTLGGYNLESREYRGVAYASCESHGQDMFLNHTTAIEDLSLYHLVLIGETGKGTVKFLVKTVFGTAELKPVTVPYNVFPQNETVITYASNATSLVNATLEYSTDSWGNMTSLPMEIVEERVCNATIQGQNASTIVDYRIRAKDILKNALEANGTYTVKYYSTLKLNLTSESVYAGQDVTVTGVLSPRIGGLAVTVVLATTNISREDVAYTSMNGSFKTEFHVNITGDWTVFAKFDGDDSIYPCSSNELTVRVEEPTFLMMYGLYIGGVVVAAGAMGSVIYFKKFRE